MRDAYDGWGGDDGLIGVDSALNETRIGGSVQKGLPGQVTQYNNALKVLRATVPTNHAKIITDDINSFPVIDEQLTEIHAYESGITPH